MIGNIFTIIISGNAIGVPEESPNWIILTILIILAVIGIILFFRKPRTKKATNIEGIRPIKRYTAKLSR